jgi:hypothetical protein
MDAMEIKQDIELFEIVERGTRLGEGANKWRQEKKLIINSSWRPYR